MGKTKVDAVQRDLKRKFALYSPRLQKWVRSLVKRESKRAHDFGYNSFCTKHYNQDQSWAAYQKERGK